MTARFITHPDFESLSPLDVFHKECVKVDPPAHPFNLQNRHLLFRKRLTLEAFSHAVLRITADDYYKLYINGSFVTQGPAPSYPNAYYYNEIDISRFLRIGENTVAVHVYYQGQINRVWVSGDLRACLWCELDVDGRTVAVSDTDWKCHDHTGYSELGTVGYGTAFREQYDSNAPEIGFEREAFDDSHWQAAAVYRHADYTLVKQPTEQLALYEMPPVLQKAIAGGVSLDFGREAVGYLSLTARGGQGDVVTLRFGEELNPDSSVRYQLRCGCFYEEKWILSGDCDTLKPFDCKGFRYAEILFPDTVTLEKAAMTVRHYPFCARRVYRTQNEDLKKVLTLCADTVKFGTQEGFWDCPTREKGQYLGDVAVAARAHAVLTRDTAAIKKAIRDFCATSFICPGIMAVSGASLMQEIADYSLQLPALVTWVYAFDGDLGLVREVEPILTGAYRYFLKHTNADGLLESVTEKWNLVDWPENLRDGYAFPLTRPVGEGAHNVLNAFWCGFLQAMDEVYSLLGMPTTGKTAPTKAAFIKAFFDPERGLFCDDLAHSHAAVHSNLLPLLFDIGTEDRSLTDRLCGMIISKGLSSMGVYTAYFALAALVSHGRRKEAEALATAPDCWLNMIAEGGTTTFEAWGKEKKWNTSLCHPWAAAPLIVFADEVRVY